MASSFINAGAKPAVGDSASADVYTCPKQAQKQLFTGTVISNLNSSGTSKKEQSKLRQMAVQRSDTL